MSSSMNFELKMLRRQESSFEGRAKLTKQRNRMSTALNKVRGALEYYSERQKWPEYSFLLRVPETMPAREALVIIDEAKGVL